MASPYVGKLPNCFGLGDLVKNLGVHDALALTLAREALSLRRKVAKSITIVASRACGVRRVAKLRLPDAMRLGTCPWHK